MVYLNETIKKRQTKALNIETKTLNLVQKKKHKRPKLCFWFGFIFIILCMVEALKCFGNKLKQYGSWYSAYVYYQNTQHQQQFIVTFCLGHFMSRYRQVPTF